MFCFLSGAEGLRNPPQQLAGFFFEKYWLLSDLYTQLATPTTFSYLPLWKFTDVLKQWAFQREMSSSNLWFSGAVLVVGRSASFCFNPFHHLGSWVLSFRFNLRELTCSPWRINCWWAKRNCSDRLIQIPFCYSLDVFVFQGWKTFFLVVMTVCFFPDEEIMWFFVYVAHLSGMFGNWCLTLEQPQANQRLGDGFKHKV